jgi:hypothetical protein
MHTKYASGIQLPEPTTVTVGAIDIKGDLTRSLVETTMSIVLPHDWMYFLATFHPMQFEELFATPEIEGFWNGQSLNNPKFFQNPMLDNANWKQKTIPLVLHGDGASFSSRDSLLTYSIKGLLTAESRGHLLLACFPRSCTASRKRIGLRFSLSW